MKNSIFKSLFILSLFISGILIHSCTSSSTVITGTWNSDDIEKDYSNIMVSALTNDMEFRSSLEEEIAESISDDDDNAVTSLNILPAGIVEENTQKEEILNNVHDKGIDAILTVTLIDQDMETRYVPGNVPYAPYPAYTYYGTYWTYYDYWYPRFQSPGYYTTERTYFIETNLYDAETEELVWSAQSRTYDPANLVGFTREFGNEIASELERQNII
jgi:hypothetical protein